MNCILGAENAKRIPRFRACLHSWGPLMLQELQVPPVSQAPESASQVVLQLRDDQMGPNKNVLQTFMVADVAQSQTPVAVVLGALLDSSPNNQGLSVNLTVIFEGRTHLHETVLQKHAPHTRFLCSFQSQVFLGGNQAIWV